MAFRTYLFVDEVDMNDPNAAEFLDLQGEEFGQKVMKFREGERKRLELLKNEEFSKEKGYLFGAFRGVVGWALKAQGAFTSLS